MKTKIIALDNFKDFDSAYWGMGSCSDGNIYFGLCTHIPGKSAGFFKYSPQSETVEHLFNVNEVLGSVHGKIHTPIVEAANKKLYFGTHFAYPYGDPTKKVEYIGGHLISYDPTTGATEDLGIVSKGEGVLTIALDKKAGKIYSLTVPGGVFAVTEITSSRTTELGRIPSNGSICRTLTVDAKGNVYGSYEANGLFIFDSSKNKLIFKDNFFPEEQVKEWDDPTRGGVNKIGRNLWRCADYDENSNKIYGIYSASSRLFTIDCETLELELLSPMTPSSFGASDVVYPTLTMVSNKDHCYYVPADGMFDYCRSDNLSEFSHAMTFNKATGKNSDLGELNAEGVRVYGAAGAVLSDGRVYLLGASESSVGQKRDVREESQLFYIKDKPFNLSLIEMAL